MDFIVSAIAGNAAEALVENIVKCFNDHKKSEENESEGEMLNCCLGRILLAIETAKDIKKQPTAYHGEQIGKLTNYMVEAMELVLKILEAKPRSSSSSTLSQKVPIFRRRPKKEATMNAKVEKIPIVWTKVMDEALIRRLKSGKARDILIVNVQTYPWTELQYAIEDITGLSLDVVQVKEHVRHLLVIFRLYFELTIRRGWTWDSKQMKPVPQDPVAWDHITNENESYIMCKEEPFPYYDDFVDILDGQNGDIVEKLNSLITGLASDNNDNHRDKDEDAQIHDDDQGNPGKSSFKQESDENSKSRKRSRKIANNYSQGKKLDCEEKILPDQGHRPKTDSEIPKVDLNMIINDLKKSAFQATINSRNEKHNRCMKKFKDFSNQLDDDELYELQQALGEENFHDFFLDMEWPNIKRWLGKRRKQQHELPTYHTLPLAHNNPFSPYETGPFTNNSKPESSSPPSDSEK